MHLTRWNYGSALQSFSLQRFLSENGFDPEIIDYVPKFRESNNMRYPYKDIKPKSLNALYRKAVFFINKKSGEYIDDSFKRFFKECTTVSKKQYKYSDSFTDNYDAFVIGSDTVWDIGQTKGFEKGYWGLMPGMKNNISYAASFGEAVYNEKEAALFNEYISSFKSVSIRENTNPILFKEAPDKLNVVVDPTFLIDKEEFRRIEKRPQFMKNINKPYVLYFILQTNRKANGIVKQIAKEKGCEVIEISKNFYRNIGKGYKVVYGLSVEEWLWLFDNANYVFTNSFHGVAFSIIFEKNFSCFCRKDAHGKIFNLCGISGLTSRIIDLDNIEAKDLKEKITDINYKKPKDLIHKKAEESRKWLIEQIRNCEPDEK